MVMDKRMEEKPAPVVGRLIWIKPPIMLTAK